MYPSADPGLSGFFDTIGKIAGKVGRVAGTVSQVATQGADVEAGRSQVAVIPTGGSYATFGMPGQPYGASVPLLPVLLGVGVLAFLLSRRR